MRKSRRNFAKGGQVTQERPYKLEKIEDDCPRMPDILGTSLANVLAPGKQSPHGAKLFVHTVQTRIWSGKNFKTIARDGIRPESRRLGSALLWKPRAQGRMPSSISQPQTDFVSGS